VVNTAQRSRVFAQKAVPTAIALTGCILHLISISRAEATELDWFLWAGSNVARLYLARNIAVEQFSTWFIWIHIEASFFGAFAFYPEVIADEYQLLPNSIVHSIRLGAVALLIIFFTTLVLRSILVKTRKVNPKPLLATGEFRNLHIVSFFAVGSAFGIALTCNYLGISLMGGPYNVELPFRLKGILNVTRIWLVPLVLLILIHIAYSRENMRLGNFILISFFIWSIMESAFRASRSTIAYAGILLIIYFTEARMWTRRLVVVAISLVILGILTFSLITAIRTGLEQTTVDLASISEGIKRRKLGEQNHPFREVYFRQFQSGIFCAKYYQAMTDTSGGDWGAVMAAGGPALYHTEDINGIYGRQYSAGSTTLASGFLLGGWFGIILASCLVAFLALYIDTNRLGIFTANIPSKAYLVYLYVIFVNEDFFVIFTIPESYALMFGGILGVLLVTKNCANINNLNNTRAAA
jgi:hypothetical protein